ncbi:YkyA family protein [Pseudalkalibacillus decolorationis]|uniref:YkyA family protein n=1 Tax=Pseudalkalibacillus decolorationis TaxID=163879 RepID=UPI00214911AA|nr:YkyA family protein [Pseudalkalibacillus decolorationis]
MFSKKIAILSVCFVIILSSGCSFGQSSLEKIYEHLEETVSLESGFSKVQDPLVKAEKKEQELFSEILTLSMEEFDKIKSLADQASELANSRSDFLKKEKESIHNAYEEFKSIEPIVKDLEKEKLKDKANDLVGLMKDRFKRYNELNTAYNKALEMDQKLYDMLKNEKLSLDELKKYIGQLNKQYEQVFKAQEKFNELTEEYNANKKAFYKEAGFTS